MTTTEIPMEMPLEEKRSFFIEYRNQLIAAILAISALLGGLVLGAGVEELTSVFQFWLVFVIVALVVVTLSSKMVRQSRKWHGVDWWLAVLSAILLSVFIVIGIIPEYLAPYGAEEEVGPSLLQPGEVPPTYILIARSELGYESFFEIGLDEEGNVIERASQSRGVGAVDEQAGRLVGQEKEQQGLQNAIERNRSMEGVSANDALQALATSDLESRRPLVAVVGQEEDFADLVKEYDNLEVVGPIGPTFESGFILGTNKLGQDMFSRLMFGARTTLLISISAALFSSIIGIPLGLISGYVGGVLDRILAPLMDSIYSFPGLILAIAIASAFGRGILTVIAAIGVIYIPTYYRVVRSQTLSVKEAAYVEAGHSLGATNITLLWRYVFPNVFASVVVIFSINIADAILTGAGLAFLSLGLPETIPDWGVDLVRGNELVLSGEWWLVVFPGLAIALLTLCFSMLGESLSEILNPRLNRS